MPGWILYSLADGLWVYAYINLMLYIWDCRIDGASFFWFFIVPFLSIFSEILQSAGILSGTFDAMDLFMYLFFTIISFINLKTAKQIC
jgi:hypothetical protein